MASMRPWGLCNLEDGSIVIATISRKKLKREYIKEPMARGPDSAEAESLPVLSTSAHTPALFWGMATLLVGQPVYPRTNAAPDGIPTGTWLCLEQGWEMCK